MDRVNSSAIRSLAAYNDDSEEESGGEAGTSAEAAPASPSSPSKDEVLQKQSPPLETSNAPASNSAEDEGSRSEGGHSSRSDSLWISDLESSDAKAQRRAQFYNSPSNGASYPSETPSSVSMSRMPSGIALVSYGAEDDDENDRRRNSTSSDVVPVDVAMNSGGRNESRLSQVSSAAFVSTMANDDSQSGFGFEVGGEVPRRAAKSEDDDEEIDVDVLLEKPLADGNADVSESKLQSAADIALPPMPSGRCSPTLEAKFKEFFRRKAEGYDFNKAIQNRTDFRNPSIYEKLIEHFGIDEIGTNFSHEAFDPHGFKPSDFYDEISKVQRTLMEKLEKEKHSVKESNILAGGIGVKKNRPL